MYLGYLQNIPKIYEHLIIGRSGSITFLEDLLRPSISKLTINSNVILEENHRCVLDAHWLSIVKNWEVP